MRLCWHKEEAHLGKGSGPDGCLPACYASHSKSRRDGGVPAFTRMLSNTMTLDETYPTEQVWWFLDIRTYLSVLCAGYYPDELGDMLLSHPYSRPVLVRSAERGNLGTQRELHSFVFAMLADGDVRTGETSCPSASSRRKAYSQPHGDDDASILSALPNKGGRPRKKKRSHIGSRGTSSTSTSREGGRLIIRYTDIYPGINETRRRK